MSKEPLGLYILRILTACGLFIFMAMLYWSSLLEEEDLKKISGQIDELSTTIKHGNYDSSFGQIPKYSSKVPRQSHEDPSLPNLLTEDSFYDKTLPKLLGADFRPHGVFRDDVLGRPNNLHPFSDWYQISQWTSLCTLAPARGKFGFYETQCPYNALKMEQRKAPDGSLSDFWIHLREGVSWMPLKKEFFSEDIHLAPKFLEPTPVTAHDYKFFWYAVMNPFNQQAGAVSLRTYLDDIEEIKIIDDYTFTVRWKTVKQKNDQGVEVSRIRYTARQLTGGMLRPLASHIYKFFPDGKKIVEDDNAPDTYRTNSVWAQNFAEHWARNIIPSCGPWMFDGMTDRQISFKRNDSFFMPLAALGDGIEFQFKESPDGQWLDFKTNKVDSYSLQPDQLLEWENFKKSEEYAKQVKEGYAISRLDFLAQKFNYLGWNQAKNWFKNKKVRQALTMAIDRQRIIRQNMNGLAIEITGPASPYATSEYDPSIKPWPFDLLRAKRLLEEEGWYDHDGDGVIDKVIDGKKVDFRFNLTYYVKNPLTKSICEYIATALKEVGIICNLNGVELADLTAAFEEKNFDAIYLGWVLGTPPSDWRQIWYSKGAKERGSSNAIGFANKEVDEIIDQLEYEDNPVKRRELYYRFNGIIHEEQPYTFLYAPKTAFLYREYLKNVFIPAERQDLVPGADVPEPDSSIFWLKRK